VIRWVGEPDLEVGAGRETDDSGTDLGDDPTRADVAMTSWALLVARACEIAIRWRRSIALARSRWLRSESTCAVTVC